MNFQPSLKDVGSDSDVGSQLEGDIIIPGLSNAQTESGDGDFNTLDEPIMSTIVSYWNPMKIMNISDNYFYSFRHET